MHIYSFYCSHTALDLFTVQLKQSQLWIVYLLPGIKDHDIISSKVVLGHLSRNLLNLMAGQRFSGNVNDALCTVFTKGFRAFRSWHIYILKMLDLKIQMNKNILLLF